MARKTLTLALVFVAVSAASVIACSVPVFRYALEQWQPDSFQVFVFHEGELTAEQKALVARIEPASLDAKYTANAVVRLVDLSQTQDEAVVQLWEEQETTTLPWMLVKSPSKKFGPPLTVIAQEFSEENVARLLTSPARKRITEGLLKGDSAYWVFLESGDKQQDDEKFKILQTELKRLQGVLKLPEIEEQDIQDGSITVDPDELKLKFSVVRVSRNDPNEQAFVQMLLTTEPDLRDEDFQKQPMALPIFGRGRALYALIGNGIMATTEDEPGTIEDACRFLTGACQCTVKAQNPGVDILTTIDWDSHIVPQLQSDTELPTLTGLSGFGDDNENEPEASNADAGNEEESNGEQVAMLDAASNASPQPTDQSSDNKSDEAAESSAAAPVSAATATPAEVASGISFTMIIAATIGGLAVLAFLGSLLLPRRT